MRSSVLLHLLAACTASPSADRDPASSEGTTTNPGSPTSVPPAAPSIGEVSATPRSSSQAAVSVALPVSAKVAAACVRRDDPAEIHLVEGEGSGTVELRFSGLLGATDYDCKVALTDTAAAGAEVTFRTPDPPETLATADVVANPDVAMTGAYTVMNARRDCQEPGVNRLVVIDPDGNNRWTYELPPGMNIGIEVTLDGKDRFLWGGGQDRIGSPTVVDVWDGQVWKLDFPGAEDVEFHHDASRIDDGRVLSVEDTFDNGWAAFQLRLSDDAGETSWLWNVQSAVATGWLGGGSVEHDDPHHLNWADVVDTDGGLVAYGSLCYAFLVVAIDVASGEPLWKFGYDGDFTLVDEAGQPLSSQDDFPQCQHGLQTDGTHLFVFDNGFNRGYSRAVEYTLDLEAKTATRTWEWLDDGFWEMYHGGVEWLTPDHQRVLVAESNNSCGESARNSQIVELDRGTGVEVHRLILRDIGDWIYRAHRIDGCDLFANTKYCPALAERLEELRPVLGL